MKTAKFSLYIFLVGAGAAVGAHVAELTAGVSFLSWLGYGLFFGTESPLVLDLHLFKLTFGISVKITVSSVLFIALSLILGRLILKKE